MRSATFKKNERLKSRKVIEQLFKKGNSFAAYPLRLVWLPQEAASTAMPVQFAVSVPKRNFKSAVARNRIKRKIREAWRLNKQWLYEKLEDDKHPYAFMVIYIAREDLTYDQIENAMRILNRRFLKKRP